MGLAFSELVLLGAIAGFTIFLGLPVARMRGISARAKGMLNAASAGILLFLLVDVMAEAFEATEVHALASLAGREPLSSGLVFILLLVGGASLGLLGLVWFEEKFLQRKGPRRHPMAALDEKRARAVATMIAIGIGLHNFSEGLAIGQSYAAGSLPFALLLVVGFGLHNSTEGFGIAAPLSGFRPSWKFLAFLGLIGGGPTFVGAVVGGFWVSEAVSVLFFSLAGGAIVYVVKELLFHGKLSGESVPSMSALLAGFFLGFLTDVLIKSVSGA